MLALTICILWQTSAFCEIPSEKIATMIGEPAYVRRISIPATADPAVIRGAFQNLDLLLPIMSLQGDPLLSGMVITGKEGTLGIATRMGHGVLKLSEVGHDYLLFVGDISPDIFEVPGAEGKAAIEVHFNRNEKLVVITVYLSFPSSIISQAVKKISGTAFFREKIKQREVLGIDTVGRMLEVYGKILKQGEDKRFVLESYYGALQNNKRDAAPLPASTPEAGRFPRLAAGTILLAALLAGAFFFPRAGAWTQSRLMVKRIVFWLMLLLVMLGGMFGMGEALLRLSYNPPIPFDLCGGSNCVDARYGLHSCPNYSCGSRKRAILSRNPKSTQHYVLNSLGLRDREITIPKPPATYRVMFLGDSMVAGWGVQLDETLGGQFSQKYFRAPFMQPKAVDVVNAGHSGFCTYQEAEWYLAHYDTLDPDMIFLVFFFNDVTNYKGRMSGKISHGFEVPDGFASIDKHAGIWVTQPFDPREFLFLNSYLYQFFRFWVMPAFGLGDTAPTASTAKGLMLYAADPLTKAKLKGVEEDMVRIFKHAQAHGKKFSVIYLPVDVEVAADDTPGLFHDELLDIGKRNGFPIIDTLPALRQAKHRGIKVHGTVKDGDTHLTADGIGVVVDLALRHIKN